MLMTVIQKKKGCQSLNLYYQGMKKGNAIFFISIVRHINFVRISQKTSYYNLYMYLSFLTKMIIRSLLKLLLGGVSIVEFIITAHRHNQTLSATLSLRLMSLLRRDRFF